MKDNYFGQRSYRFEASHYEQIFDPTMTMREQREIFGKAVLPHGHNYELVVSVKAPVNKTTSMIVDLSVLDKIVNDTVLAYLDHINITDYYHKHCQPVTIEFIASRILSTIKNVDFRDFIPLGGKVITISTSKIVSSITLNEDEKTSSLHIALDEKDKYMFHRIKSYSFSAQHKLYNDKLDRYQNLNVFGKCIREHGHNYTLFVDITGIPNPITNKIVVEHKLDTLIENFLEEFDYNTFNDHRLFKDKIPTTETIVKVFWDELKPLIATMVDECPHAGDNVRLYALELKETERNSFAYTEHVPSLPKAQQLLFKE